MSDQSATGITGVLQVAITVKDLERSTAFYRDRLGLPHLFTSNGMAFFQCGGTRLMLGLQEQGKPDTYSSIVYFNAPDIQASYRAMSDRGVAFAQPPALIARLPGKNVWLATLRDPDGNVLGLMSEVPA